MGVFSEHLLMVAYHHESGYVLVMRDSPTHQRLHKADFKMNYNSFHRTDPRFLIFWKRFRSKERQRNANWRRNAWAAHHGVQPSPNFIFVPHHVCKLCSTLIFRNDEKPLQAREQMLQQLHRQRMATLAQISEQNLAAIN